jgi:hypothetical protein
MLPVIAEATRHAVNSGIRRFCTAIKVSELFHRLPSSSVIGDHDAISSHSTDWTGRFSGQARMVLKPTSTDDVSYILRECNRYKIPVVPQGGNTGLAGGSVPIKDEVIISMSRMNKILDFKEVQYASLCCSCSYFHCSSYMRTSALPPGLSISLGGSSTLSSQHHGSILLFQASSHLALPRCLKYTRAPHHFCLG